MFIRDLVKYTLIILILSLYVSCSFKSESLVRPDGEDLRTSVIRYWNYRMQSNLYKSYDYEHVSYTGVSTRDFYMGGFGGQPVIIKGFEIIKDIDESNTTSEGYVPVNMRMKLVYPQTEFKVPESIEVDVVDLWVKRDGRWYHLLQRFHKLY